jgi:hypothetical protein
MESRVSLEGAVGTTEYTGPVDSHGMRIVPG